LIVCLLLQKHMNLFNDTTKLLVTDHVVV
jgi:hypothetical protein